ncbi:MAG: molybdopterin-dependent oxidoreductase [Kofleriaceae bacterium]
MTTRHYPICPLCEATCGLAVDVDGDRVASIRGDADDPFSRGYLCPKATALADLHHDPDRLRTPLVRTSGRHEPPAWRDATWDEALGLVASRLAAIRAEHGADAVGAYIGNPGVHNLGLLTHGLALTRSLGSRNLYSAASVDQLPHMLAALLMFGNQLLMPVPDLDRTDLLIVLGGNPAASNGSIMTAPDVMGRLAAIRARGGQVVVIDPRRTETARDADRHLFIRPGTDALLLWSIVHVLFAEERLRLGRLGRFVDGVDALRAAAADAALAPEATAAATGIAADDVRELARALAETPRAVLYGRLGVCAQEFGGQAAWLCNVINTLTGHLDTEGGMMFTTPAVDPLPLAVALGLGAGGFARWRTRVRGLPEFGGESPLATLVDEIETPGRGQLRALVTIAGNPVLSVPGGPRLEAALPTLAFQVAIDPYLNETTRLADVILPPTTALERAHYDVALAAYSIRNVARYAPPVFPRGDDQRHDWEICAELTARLAAERGGVGALARRVLGGDVAEFLGRHALAAGKVVLDPDRLLDVALRAGPHGLRRGEHGLSLARLRRAPHGLDLGPLEPRLPGRLATADKRIVLAPPVMLADLPRLRGRAVELAAPASLVLIGRRSLRSHNSWLHNSARLVKGKPRCVLWIHPDDAAARGLATGDTARLASTVGAIEVPVAISDEVMPGVVSLPHGWGHGRPGARLRVAATVPGVSINDVTDPARVDELTGTAALSGQPVTVARVEAAP